MVAHNYEEPKHVFHPYQVRLQDGSLIFAPEDSDEYIQANWTKPRFEIGTCVLCKYGDQWVKGTVVMHNCEASMGVFHPYQVKLHHGAWVYVPADEDTFIQRAAFAVGDRVRVRNLTQKNDILGTIVGQDSGRLRVALGDEGGGGVLRESTVSRVGEGDILGVAARRERGAVDSGRGALHAGVQRFENG